MKTFPSRVSKRGGGGAPKTLPCKHTHTPRFPCKQYEHKAPRSQDFGLKSHYRAGPDSEARSNNASIHMLNKVCHLLAAPHQNHMRFRRGEVGACGARGRGALPSRAARGVSKRVKINRAATNMHNKERGGIAPVGGIQRNSFGIQYPSWQNVPSLIGQGMKSQIFSTRSNNPL